MLASERSQNGRRSTSQLSAGTRLPEDGMVFLSLADRDKASGVEAAWARGGGTAGCPESCAGADCGPGE